MTTQTSSFESDLLCASVPPATIIAHPCRELAFPKWFERQVEEYPERIAVEFEQCGLSYRQLNAQANQLARYLTELGFQREDRIGVCMDRSIDAIVAMLGVMKAGLAFVPLDPEFPQERLHYIVEHAGIRRILCHAAYQQLFTPSDRQLLVRWDPQQPPGSEQDSENLPLDLPLESLAYVMFTSGSTGKPKGVQIEHRALTTYCQADIEIYRLHPTDRTLQFSTLNFDIAIEEILPPLLVGSTVVVRPRQRAEAAIELSHWIETYQATAIHVATAYWNEWVDLMVAHGSQVPACLRLVIVTGEKISVEHYRRWQKLCQHDILWCNAYGPTETTVSCTVFIPPDGWSGSQMPIGKPLSGYEAHILDDELRPVGAGATGSLFIGGPALARGYLGRPDLDAKAFLHVTLPGTASAKRLYRTGDLARWLPNGEIDFAGRVDHQMKIGSYRIEPGEIEATIHQYPSVRESLVICVERESIKSLVAYVVGDATFTLDGLAEFLRRRLPVYMVPAKYVLLDEMPKTINGKIDRFALPSPEVSVTALTAAKRGPRNEWEQFLKEVWEEVLQLSGIGIDDDFFLLGGSSLLVTRVIAKVVRKRQIVIPVRDFFANPTIAALSEQMSALPIPSTAHGSRGWLRRTLPELRPIGVPASGIRLSAMHYPPVPQESLPTGPGRLVIVCPSYAHEQVRAYRNLQQLSVLLAQKGFHVVRFDYGGTGDSEGTAERVSLECWADDLQHVIAYFRQQLGHVPLSLVSHRLGAAVVQAAGIRDALQHVAWDPVLDGPAYAALIQRFHDYELRSRTLFLGRRHSRPDERMGYAWPEHFADELATFHWEPQLIEGQVGAVVWSKGMNSAKLSVPRWHEFFTDDEIYWDMVKWKNSAFSSPAAFGTIVDLLEGNS